MQDTSAAIIERFRRGRSADIDLTLRAAYRDLLLKLGDPQNKLPPVLHVAGTNGKGSTCAFLRAMVEAAGYKAHVYTSPHLVSFHERIRVAGDVIGENELVEILQECERHAEPGGVTYFEAATAAAFAAFARHQADITILEVGLGGRLDSTNVIPRTAATYISRISFDHREYLGTTLAEIACEKAGIMQKATPCYVAPQPATEVLAALRQAAEPLEVPLAIGGHDWSVELLENDQFRFNSPSRSLTLPRPALAGPHQLWNAGLAIASLPSVPLPISDAAIRNAMLKVEWPARLQRLTKGAVASMLPSGCELWLDGGHNDSAGEVLAAQMALWQQQNAKPLSIILGMLNTKIPGEFLQPMIPFIHQVYTVDIEDEALNCPATALAQQVREAGISRVMATGNVEQAVSQLATIGPPGRILICGSLYLAGQVLRLNQSG